MSWYPHLTWDIMAWHYLSLYFVSVQFPGLPQVYPRFTAWSPSTPPRVPGFPSAPPAASVTFARTCGRSVVARRRAVCGTNHGMTSNSGISIYLYIFIYLSDMSIYNIYNDWELIMTDNVWYYIYSMYWLLWWHIMTWHTGHTRLVGRRYILACQCLRLAFLVVRLAFLVVLG